MARRSPYNDRYRKEANTGSTRRSASSMKPKRKAAEPSSAKKTSGPAKGKTTATVAGRLPDTPEVRFYNRLYLVLFGIAIVALLPMLLGPAVFHFVPNKTLSAVLWGIYAASIGAALYVQTGPLRKLKNAALKGELPSQQAEKDTGDAGGDQGKDA